MTDKPRIGAGDIPVMLDGECVTLKPSVGAALAINNMEGGWQKAFDLCASGDFNMIARVIGLGLSYSANGPEMKAMPEKVFRSGVTDDSEGRLSTHTVRFLHCLRSGGKAPPDPFAEDEGEAKQEASEPENPPQSA